MKKILSALLILSTFFLFSSPAYAAGIAFDSSATFTGTGTSPMTMSFNNVAGNFIVCEVRSNGAADTFTAVSYGGVALTKLASINEAGLGNYVAFYYLASPATGSNTASASFSSGSARGSCATWSGVGGIESATYNSADSAAATSQTVSVTTQNDNDWLVGVSGYNGAGTAGTDTTKRVEDDAGASGIYDSNAAKTPTGSYSLKVDFTVVPGGGLIVAALYPTAVAGAAFNSWQFFGF